MTLVLQQTTVDGCLPKRFKDYADREDKTLQEVYSEAIQIFIDSYQKDNLPFLASPLDGETISFRVDAKLKLKVEKVCKNKTRVRRLYYTAIYNYAKANGLI